MEDSFYPTLKPSVILRAESVGGYLFLPRSQGPAELSSVEFRVACALNGQASISQIISELAMAEDWAQAQAGDAAWHALRRFHSLGMLDWRMTPAEESRLPEVPVFSPRDEAMLERALSAPLSVLWDITYACNLRCPHCLTGSGRAAPDELNREEALSVVQQLRDMRVFAITLCGGEPLMSPHLLEIIEAATSRGLEVNLDTNGLLVTEERAHQLAAAGVSAVQVSLDGRKETHDRFRGKEGSFAAAVRAVEIFVSLGFRVSVAPVLTKATYLDLEYLVHLAADLGAHGLKPSLFLPTGRGRDHAAALMLPPVEVKKAFRQIFELQEKVADRLYIAVDGSYPGLRSAEPPIPTGGSFAGAPVGCPAGVTQLVIAAHGQIYACPFLYDHPAGDLREKPLADIWRQARIFKVFRRMTKGQLKGHCRTCPHSPQSCAGGCRAAAYALTGDLYGEDPLWWCTA